MNAASEFAAAQALARARVAYARADPRTCQAEIERGLALSAGTETPLELDLLIERARARMHLEAQALRDEAAEVARLNAIVGTRPGAAEYLEGSALFIAGDPRAPSRLRAAARRLFAAGDLDLAYEALLVRCASFQVVRRPDRTIVAARWIADHAAANAKHVWAFQGRWLELRTRLLANGECRAVLPDLIELLEGAGVGAQAPHLMVDIALALADLGDAVEARTFLRRAEGAASTDWLRALAAHGRVEVEWANGRIDRTLAAVAAAQPVARWAAADAVESTRMWSEFEDGRPVTSDYQPVLFSAVGMEAQGFRSLARGEFRRAETEFAEAADEWSHIARRNELRALWGAAEVARRHGGRRRAARQLFELHDAASDLGLESLLRRIRRSQWLDQPTPHTSVLSHREREVMELVAGGMSSTEIARHLGIGARTVDAHVRSALAKTGARTRIQAAANAVPTVGKPLKLSSVEAQLLELLADGLSLTEAAGAAGVSRRTATRRVRDACVRLGVATTAAAVSAYRAAG
jgi:DNA-binding NarL/FixJ family response regulator